MSFALVAAAALAVVAVVHGATFLIARRVGRYNVVDIAWGIGFVAVAGVAAATWFISLPLQLSAVLGPTHPALLPVMIAGVLAWLIGLTFEAVGDYQLRTFKTDPANKGVIMDRGLWAWTRHPNYFGDAAVWWGLWLVTIASWVSFLTVFSPLLMTYFLVYVTGGRLTEKKYMRNRPGFSEYCSRTSFFVPRPPRTRRGG